MRCQSFLRARTLSVIKTPFEYVETKHGAEARYIGALSQNDTHTAAFRRGAAVTS